jgi:hypothetical protein
MDIAKPEAKLEEVKFFLEKMREQQGYPLEDQKPFTFYMNALLCAAGTLHDCFRYGQDEEAIRWKRDWEAGLAPQDKALYDFLKEDRNFELHLAGSRRKSKTEEQWLPPGSYSLTRGTREYVFAPPDVKKAVKITPQVYVIDIEGAERAAVEVCADYATLLERLIAEYKARP